MYRPDTSRAGSLPAREVSRRHALRGAAVAGVGIPFLAACGEDPEDSRGSTTSSEATVDPSAGTGASFASTRDVPEGGGAIFEDEGVVVTQPVPGEFKGFTNICTHQGCSVAEVTDTINCSCHGSMFSIEDGSPQSGPATSALEEVAITVDGDAISLA